MPDRSAVVLRSRSRPALVKSSNTGVKRVIGDLSNADRALVALDMQVAIAGEGA